MPKTVEPIGDFFLYSSQLAPAVDIRCVGEIVKTARRFNATHQITGVLVFDGVRFCQYMEGPSSAVQLLRERIAKDARHIDFQPKLQGTLQGERRFAHWSMAYAVVEEAQPLEVLERLQGELALQHLLTLLPCLDMA